MHRYVLPIVFLLALSFIGIADAAYLSDAAISGSSLSCSVSGLDGCNIVAQSAYAHIFGIPLALFGVGFYTLIFVLAAVFIFFPTRFIAFTLRAFGVIGFLASIVFILIQILLIKALCMYCLLSAFIALLIFVGAFWLWAQFPRLSHVIP